MASIHSFSTVTRERDVRDTFPVHSTGAWIALGAAPLVAVAISFGLVDAMAYTQHALLGLYHVAGATGLA